MTWVPTGVRPGVRRAGLPAYGPEVRFNRQASSRVRGLSRSRRCGRERRAGPAARSQLSHGHERDDSWSPGKERAIACGQSAPTGRQTCSEDPGVDDSRTPDARSHASSTAAMKRRSSSSARSPMRASSLGGRGRAAASMSSLVRSRLGPGESDLRASGSVIAHLLLR